MKKVSLYKKTAKQWTKIATVDATKQMKLEYMLELYREQEPDVEYIISSTRPNF